MKRHEKLGLLHSKPVAGFTSVPEIRAKKILSDLEKAMKHKELKPIAQKIAEQMSWAKNADWTIQQVPFVYWISPEAWKEYVELQKKLQGTN